MFYFCDVSYEMIEIWDLLLWTEIWITLDLEDLNYLLLWNLIYLFKAVIQKFCNLSILKFILSSILNFLDFM